MRADDFRSLNAEELDTKIAEMRKQLFDHKIRLQSNQLSNTNLIRETRREIARAMTVRNQTRSQAEGQ